MSHQLLTTAEVCRTLGITPSKLKRLTSEGYLKVEETAHLKHGKVHLFKSSMVEKLVPQLPRILRRWHWEENNNIGAKQAAEMRTSMYNAVQSIKDQKEEFLASLELVPEKTAYLLRASYYLFHLNHYAKAGNDYLYDLKEKVLKAFVNNFNQNHGLSIYYIQGGQKIYLCSACKKKARKQNQSYRNFARLTGGCPRCTRDDRFYSLYEFIVEYAEHRFCFHTPYLIARKWFKGHQIPVKFKTQRYEMGKTFGRPVLEPEAKAIPLHEVISELEDFLSCINSSYYVQSSRRE